MIATTTAARVLLLAAALGACRAGVQSSPPAGPGEPPPLEVSDNGRYLVQRVAGGEVRPFFWLGATAWNLHSLDEAGIERYLSDRAAKGFNVIQGPVLDWTGLEEMRPLSRENAYGRAAYADRDDELGLDADRPGDPWSDYFDQTDFIVRRAGELGMYVALLPFWAQGINRMAGATDGLDRLERIGLLLGGRYRDRTNVLWIVGGEAASESPPDAVNALARGLERGHGGRHLMTVHPGGARSSSAGEWRAGGASGRYDYHLADWLDFNMLQSGHGRADRANYRLITRDLAREPAKPTLEAEYWYEGGYPDEQGRVSTAYDQRKGAYWSVFAGGFGYTYGANGIWQFTVGNEPWDEDDYRSEDPWQVALAYEGAGQMIHLRRLLESRPLRSRIPDQTIVREGAGGAGDGAADHARAMRDGTAAGRNASYLMVYLPLPRSVTIDTGAIAADRLHAWWYDPRTGVATALRRDFPQTGSFRVAARDRGPDWVLVIDDARAGFPPPGRTTERAAASHTRQVRER